MSWWTDPFLLDLQQRALLAGLVAAVMASTVGVWIVMRGMSFFGDAFVHGVLPGISAAIVFGFNPYVGAAVAAVAMVAGIEIIHRTTSLKEDTSIGLLFVGMLALGVVIISKSDQYTGSLTSVLFGDILGVTSGDLRQQLVLGGVVIVASLLLYRPLLTLSFSSAKSSTLGMNPRVTHALLLALTAVVVIGNFQAVGTLLVFGLLVGPPATASLFARTIPQMTVLAMVISAFSVWSGLVLSYHLGTAGSATMALVPVALFFVCLAVTRILRRLRPRPRPRARDMSAGHGAHA